MNFLEAIAKSPLLADGAMGTMIHARGVEFEQSFDELNLLNPALILDIHRAYVAAGADILETNTFSATPLHLETWNIAPKAAEINRAGARLALQAARESNREIFVAGSIGPTNRRLAPLGPVRPEDMQESYDLQIDALVDAGVDLLIMETFADLREIELAIRSARARCDLPIVASMSFNREGLTLRGSTPEQAAHFLAALGVNVIGANCSTGPRGVVDVVARYRAELGDDNIAISAMPNAGYPENRGARLFYPATPEYFANYAKRFVAVGARLIGGCCGTTPDHIHGMRRALDELRGVTVSVVPALRERETKAIEAVADARETQLATNLRTGVFVTTVEMEPPKSTSTAELERNALMLRDAGATMLDISDIPMARMRMTGLAAAFKVQQSTGLETVLHFPVRGRNLLRVQGDLLAAHALGVRNLFVTMGDPSSIGDYPQAFDHHDIVPTGLVQLIKEQFNYGRDSAGASIGSACTFTVGVAANLTPSDLEKEAKLLKKKIDCGADFALTQPVFDAEAALAFLAYYERLYGKLKLPILAGILPLASARQAVFLKNEVPGMMLPDALVARMEAAGDQARDEGQRVAAETLRAIKHAIQGVYFIPAFRRYDILAKLIKDV